MEKIIQISARNDELYCLTRDGKVYIRVYTAIEWNEGQTCCPSPRGVCSWKELPLIEDVK